VYAADRDDAARGGFDDRAFYELFAQERSSWPMPVDAAATDGSFAPFDAWLTNVARTHY
jgi:guanine deaminase